MSEKIIDDDFRDLLAELKEKNVDIGEIKEYIVIIQRHLNKVIESLKDEESKEQIIDEYIEEYNQDLKISDDNLQAQYESAHYLEVICSTNIAGLLEALVERAKAEIEIENIKRQGKNVGGLLLENAKINSELAEKFKKINVSQSAYTKMIGHIKTLIMKPRIKTIADLKKAIPKQRVELERQMRISKIQKYISYLNEYGFLSDAVEETNKDLDELNLSELKLKLKNPLSQKADRAGNFHNIYDEDIGVIDIFESEEELERLSLNELSLIEVFYESFYLQKRLRMERAMNTIKLGNLWELIISGNEDTVREMDKRLIQKVLKKDLALTFAINDKNQITPAMTEMYNRFQSDLEMPESKIEEDIDTVRPEIANLQFLSNDILENEYAILRRIENGEFKNIKWGTIDPKLLELDNDFPNSQIIGLKSKAFRGLLTMEVPNPLAQKIFGEKEMPKFEQEEMLRTKYPHYLSGLLIPQNSYITEKVKKMHKKNPENEILAILAGKKISNTPADNKKEDTELQIYS